jgi:ABC-type branched-subunit amino acid transport system substrate-binding protein
MLWSLYAMAALPLSLISTRISLRRMLFAGCGAALALLAACGTVTDKPRQAQPSASDRDIAARPDGVASAPAGPIAERRIRVGLLLPLSGPNAALGQAMLEAAQLALFDQKDESLTLLVRDTGDTPDGAVAAARKVLDEGAEIILGPLFSASVSAVAPLARSRGVNVISFSNDISVAGDGVYLLGFLPTAQVERVVALAVGRGHGRFAVLAPDSPYGRSVIASLTRAVSRFGGELTQSATYPPEQPDLAPVVREFVKYEARRAALDEQRKQLEGQLDEVSRQALRRLEGLSSLGEIGFDTLMLPEGGTRLRSLAPLFPYYDIDPKKVRLLGTGLWDEPSLGKEPSLVGGWFASAPLDSTRRFGQRFEATYGSKAPRLASLGYDAVALVAVLAREPRADRFGRAALGDAGGFSGYNGIFRFRADGAAERGLAVLEVRANGFREIDPAPKTFQTPIN